MNVGYARVIDRRRPPTDALSGICCERGLHRSLSANGIGRAGLEDTRSSYAADPGDTLVVWRLDRFGRSLKDLVRQVRAARGEEVGFRSLKENID